MVHAADRHAEMFRKSRRWVDAAAPVMPHSSKSQDNLYRDLLEVCDSPVYALDGRGAFVYVSPDVCALTGYARDELVGHSFGMLTGGGPLQRLLDDFNGHRIDGCWRRAVEVIHKNGVGRFNGVANWRRAGNSAAIVGTLEMPESWLWGPGLRALVDLARDNSYPVMQITRNGMVIYANPAARAILDFWGCATNTRLPEEMRHLVSDAYDVGDNRQLDVKCAGRLYTLTFAPAQEADLVNVHGMDITDREQVEEALKRSYEGLEARVVERTAEIKQANDRLTSEIQERKRIEQELRDINRKLKEAQSQLLQSEKLASVGQLAAGVAHEINNPVGYIKSNLGTLKQYVADLLRVLGVYESMEHLLQYDQEALGRIRELKAQVEMDYLKEDLKDLLAESEEGVERVKRIVRDLKDFSHVDQAEWQWADIHKGLESTLNIVRNEIKYKADVVKEYGALPSVECIPSQLNQVFTNLLVNASQAIPDHGVITIRTGCREEQGRIWIEISDTGQGIPAEDLKRIFDPFFTTKPVGRGTGLGLSLSYGIIKSHHGHIEVTSVPGQGATFTVWLPVVQSEGQGDKESSGQVVLETVFEG